MELEANISLSKEQKKYYEEKIKKLHESKEFQKFKKASYDIVKSFDLAGQSYLTTSEATVSCLCNVLGKFALRFNKEIIDLDTPEYRYEIQKEVELLITAQIPGLLAKIFHGLRHEIKK